MYVGLYVKYPLVMSDFHETWIFSTDISKKKKQNIIEIVPVGARVVSCGRTDGETGMTKFIVALCNFCERA